MNNIINQQVVVRISESVWRRAAQQHQHTIRQLLQPGLLSPDTSVSLSRRDRRRPEKTTRYDSDNDDDGWTTLDPKHPIYNFLIEYYGIKGAKGIRRVSRWSPNPSLLLLRHSNHHGMEDGCIIEKTKDHHPTAGGILLEGATEDDLGTLLHLRGAIVRPDSDHNSGVWYSPAHFFGRHDPARRTEAARAATPYLWYRSILQNTLEHDPILHCYGLHEWAMQYQPLGADPPPSSKYQAHLPLRVSRTVINETVERKGVSCTHVDALRFFAPAAGPLNHHGASLERTDQLRLEQPACVHAHMDLLKIALKIQPFCDANLLQRVLQVVLQARRLDVAASPYDVAEYLKDDCSVAANDIGDGLEGPVTVIPIETAAGRALYRQHQIALMKQAEPIRRDLLQAYNDFLQLAFDPESLRLGTRSPQRERFAVAAPGSPSWRNNLLPEPTAMLHEEV